jgi:hypothetical protein
MTIDELAATLETTLWLGFRNLHARLGGGDTVVVAQCERRQIKHRRRRIGRQGRKEKGGDQGVLAQQMDTFSFLLVRPLDEGGHT